MIAPTNYLRSYVTIVYDARTIVTSFFTMPAVPSQCRRWCPSLKRKTYRLAPSLSLSLSVSLSLCLSSLSLSLSLCLSSLSLSLSLSLSENLHMFFTPLASEKVVRSGGGGLKPPQPPPPGSATPDLGQTLVSDMTFYCRPDVVGSLDSRASRSNCLFCFYGSAPIVIKRCLSLQKFKMPEFKKTASLNEHARK